jgi:hypothetical protein
LASKPYQQLLLATFGEKIHGYQSHDLVEYWMIKMNEYCGEILAARKCGIFRKTWMNDNNEDSFIVRKYHCFYDMSSEYVEYNEDASSFIMQTTYAHITSPLRRKIDLWNQRILFNIIMNVDVSSLSLFLGKEKIMEWNQWMKRRGKLERECRALCYLFSMDEKRVVLDCCVMQWKRNLKNETKCVVYIPILKSFYECKHCFNDDDVDVEKLDKNRKCEIFLFEKEYRSALKIRMVIQ